MWRFWIDVGGTFTDCVACDPNGQLHTWKTLSSGRLKGRVLAHQAAPDGLRLHDPGLTCTRDGFWTGWQLALLNDASTIATETTVLDSTVNGELLLSSSLGEVDTQQSFELFCDEEAPLICIRRLLGLRLDESLPPLELRLGTTRGTNALLERKGARTALLTTAGFGDILQIGSQERPDLFALTIRKPTALAERAVEIHERLSANGEVLEPLDVDHVRCDLQTLRRDGIEAIAICLLHAYRNPIHEQLVAQMARDVGFAHVCCSSDVAPVIKLVPRAETTVVDAYLSPVLQRYVDGIHQRLTPGSRFKLMTSSGGLIDAANFSGKDSILSGPAGGVIGYAQVAQHADALPAIGFDMGGTSTDVSRYAGTLELEPETRKAGVRLAVPTLAI
ncbi:MAG: hydantoinase, partial [Planctomycetaceae bacterium]|nr:hydantoinase [Planctomycetaceae bacterium]